MPLGSASPVIVCTLWEKDHHKGVATLVNSLVRMGYRGRVWAGYRGDLPPWAAGGAANGDVYTFAVGVEVEVVFIKIQSDPHFAWVKPTWMLRLLETFSRPPPDASEHQGLELAVYRERFSSWRG
jgi:hypothetical protein